MKVKLLYDYSDKHKKGDEIEIDKIVYDDKYAGKYKVRVINGLPKSCKYLAITWIVRLPNGIYL